MQQLSAIILWIHTAQILPTLHANGKSKLQETICGQKASIAECDVGLFQVVEDGRDALNVLGKLVVIRCISLLDLSCVGSVSVRTIGKGHRVDIIP